MDTFTDEQFLHAFLTFPPTQFHHRDHLRVAWSLVRQYDLEEALRLARASFQAFARHCGRPELYHETLTQFWVRIVACEILRHPTITDFEAFLADSPLLLDKDLPYRHWQRKTLEGDAARAAWVEPDTLMLPSEATL